MDGASIQRIQRITRKQESFMKGKPLAGIKSPSSVQFQSFLYLHLGFLTRTERLSKLEREMHYYWG